VGRFVTPTGEVERERILVSRIVAERRNLPDRFVF
jgi:hypothetical protein